MSPVPRIHYAVCRLLFGAFEGNDALRLRQCIQRPTHHLISVFADESLEVKSLFSQVSVSCPPTPPLRCSVHSRSLARSPAHSPSAEQPTRCLSCLLTIQGDEPGCKDKKRRVDDTVDTRDKILDAYTSALQLHSWPSLTYKESSHGDVSRNTPSSAAVDADRDQRQRCVSRSSSSTASSRTVGHCAL